MADFLLRLKSTVEGYLDKHATEDATKSILRQVESKCSLKPLTDSQVDAVQNYWFPLVHKKVDTRMHMMLLSLTGIFKPEFEPFEICHQVQVRSMVPKAMRYFDDKNLYRSLLSGFNTPDRVAECSNGVFFLPDSTSGGAEIEEKEFISGISNVRDCLIKPSVGTSGGSGILPFDTVDGIEQNTNLPVTDLIKRYGLHFCIERKIKESNNLQRLNPTSCNTLRVHTMRDRKGHKVRFLSSYIRIGKLGQVVDNMHSGGIGARIYEDGCLRNAVACYPYKKFEITESGIQLDGYKIENYDKIIDTCVSAHSRLTMFDFMGWDVAVDNEGRVIIIEYNPNPDVRVEQAIFGDTCLLSNQEWVMKQYFG